MNKQELIETISTTTGFTKIDTKQCLDAFIETVIKSLKQGEDVRFVGFGTFSVHKRQATTGRNPRTGEALKIPASKQAKFKAGKTLKEVLN